MYNVPVSYVMLLTAFSNLVLNPELIYGREGLDQGTLTKKFNAPFEELVLSLIVLWFVYIPNLKIF